MKHHPTPKQAGLIVTATALVLATAPATAHAAGGSVPHPSAVAKTALVAKKLGSRSAGSFYADSSKKTLVVTVTNEADARAVRAAGGVAKWVARSGAQLQQVKDKLNQSIRIPGTAWYVDPRIDQVVVSVDSTVTGANLTKVKSEARSLGQSVRLKTSRGRIRTLLDGGDAIWGPGLRCSLGFNVHDSSGNAYFLTAGHCGNAANDWYADEADSQHIGTTQASSFPGTDYAIVAYDQGQGGDSAVDNYDGTTQQITGAADATVGETVTRSGSTSGEHSGTVNGLDATVNYSEGTVYGLIDTDVCAEPGDSGGSLFDGSSAIGLTSGGSGDCTSGGETFFQPVTAALSAYGVSIP